jgi:hypothetical protein
MKTVCCLLLLVTAFLPALATALTRDEAYEMARGGDAGAIEAAFAAHQAAFNAGEIGPNIYQRPYSVFWTTEPLVETTIDGWLAAYPDSPQAAYAKAARISHIAHLIRGGDFAAYIPAEAVAQYKPMFRAARDLLRTVLDREPRHLSAGYALRNAGAFLSSGKDRTRGSAIVDALDTPADALLSGLRYTYARWGGNPLKTSLFCAERAPQVAKINFEECLAKADYDHGDTDPALYNPAITILSKGSINYFLEQHIAALSRDGHMEEAYALAKSRNFMNYQLATALANGLHQVRILEEFVAENLRQDPLNPADLTSYAASLASLDDLAGAWEALDKAMIYGTYSHYVRWTRITLMMRDPERKWELLDEILRASVETKGNMDILGGVLFRLMNPEEYLVTNRDGTPRLDFECKRLRLFEQHKQNCEIHTSSRRARPAPAARNPSGAGKTLFAICST